MKRYKPDDWIMFEGMPIKYKRYMVSFYITRDHHRRMVAFKKKHKLKSWNAVIGFLLSYLDNMQNINWKLSSRVYRHTHPLKTNGKSIYMYTTKDRYKRFHQLKTDLGYSWDGFIGEILELIEEHG